MLVSVEISAKYKNQHQIKSPTLKRGLKQSLERKQSCYQQGNFSCDDFVWVKDLPRGDGWEGGGRAVYLLYTPS